MNILQTEILKVYDQYRNICEKHNLTYYAIGGTCIGAVRHKGFIPWDDDIDVAMPIDDYIKFRKIAKMELSHPFELIDYVDEKFHVLYFLKVHNVNTTYISMQEINNKNRYKGIFIDIMPLIGCPKDEIKQKKYMRKLSFYMKFNNLRTISFSQRDTLKSKLFWIICKPVSLLFKKTFFISKWDKLLTKYPINDDNLIMMPWRVPKCGTYSTFFPSEYFTRSITVPFETTEIAIPHKYNDYLTDDFGNYMKLPPKNEQVSNHDIAKIDLNKSYKEYNPVDFKNIK